MFVQSNRRVMVWASFVIGLIGVCLAGVRMGNGEDAPVQPITGPRLFTPSKGPIRSQNESRGC